MRFAEGSPIGECRESGHSILAYATAAIALFLRETHWKDVFRKGILSSAMRREGS